jgi:hypothetical protein
VKDPERGRAAVVAAQSTEEGGEARPKRPTGGKAPSSRASAGGRQGRDFEFTNPDPRQASGLWGKDILARAAVALLEESYACIAHVRVCGGGAPFNGIRDRSRRELRVDSGVRGTQHASRCGTPWGVKPVDNGPTSASHTADERATPAT